MVLAPASSVRRFLQPLGHPEFRIPGSGDTWRRTAGVIVGYVFIYLALDWLSLIQVVKGDGFSLWDPTAGLALALVVIGGLRYITVVFLAGVLADVFIEGCPLGLPATILVNVFVTIGYAAIAGILLRSSDVAHGLRRVRDVMRLLLVTAAGTLVVAILVTGSLLLMQKLPAVRLTIAIRHFWGGEFSGAMALLPALLTVRLAWERWWELTPRVRIVEIGVFAVGLMLALWLVLEPATDRQFQFFYLLLLPIIWVGVRHGLPWCAMAVLIEQVVLIALLSAFEYSQADFLAFQELLLAIAVTGLALGAVVTERQHAELSLRRQQAELGRMARLTTVGALGTAIVHEVSQPLATIATYVHACRRSLKADAGGSSALAETLAKAEAEALRAGEIIERLRDFLSQNNVRLYPADLANSAHKIAAALADEARSRNVHVAIDAQPLTVIMVDQVQIEQVLLNLVRNAIDAAADHHNGEKWVWIRARQIGEELEFAVEDNGPGIAPDIAERLFEPFETTKPRGLGLGLSLSYRIIEAHQGRLWCDKTAREGARFVFRIPYHRTAAHD